MSGLFGLAISSSSPASCALVDGVLVAKGKLGADITVDEGQAAARVCAINLLAQGRGGASAISTGSSAWVRLGGFVQFGPRVSSRGPW